MARLMYETITADITNMAAMYLKNPTESKMPWFSFLVDKISRINEPPFFLLTRALMNGAITAKVIAAPAMLAHNILISILRNAVRMKGRNNIVESKNMAAKMEP